MQPHNPGSRRRRRSGRRLRIARVTLGLTAIGLATAGLMWASARHTAVAGRQAFKPHDVNVESTDWRRNSQDRPVYRYSVIPGGAYDPQELADAVDRDPVVAMAYRDVAGTGVHAEVVRADTLAYMSYRIGDHIFWTKHRVHLRRGETILTNGSTQIRGRCGNGISLDPMLPTADDEPGPVEFDALTVGDPLPSRPIAFELGTGSLSARQIGPPDLWLADGLFPGSKPAESPSPDNPSLNSVPPSGMPPGSDDTLPIGLPIGAQLPGPPDQPAIEKQIVTISIGVDTPTFEPPPGGPNVPPGGLPPESPVPTPEPASILLVGGGLVAAGYRKLRHGR